MKRRLAAGLKERTAAVERKDICSTATLLDARYKNKFFSTPEIKKEAEERLKRLLEAEVDVDFDDLEEQVNVDINVNVAPQDENDDDIESMFKAVKKKVNQDTGENAGERESVESVLKKYYLKLEDDNLLFWSRYEEENKNSKISQALCKIARKYLTPPPTSTNVERLFSTASLISDGRPRLLPENLEKLLFLKENLKMKTIVIDY